MAGGTVLTLADMAKRSENGMPAKIAELLAESHPELMDIPWVPSNKTSSHVSTVRTGLPTVYTRKLNEGSLSSKSTTGQSEDGMALVDAWSTIDTKLLAMAPDPMTARIQEGAAFIESMGQKVSELIWTGSVADDETEFNGFSSRLHFSSLGDRCLDASGTTTLSSIWLIVWHPDTVFGIYPKNTAGGLQHSDMGKEVIQTQTALGGTKLEAWVDHWMWDCGIVVKDPRQVMRIANIEHTEFLGVSGDHELLDYATNALYLMDRAVTRIWNLNKGKACWYMPRLVFEGFMVQMQAHANANIFKVSEIGNRREMTYAGIPIRVCDQLPNTETALT